MKSQLANLRWLLFLLFVDGLVLVVAGPLLLFGAAASTNLLASFYTGFLFVNFFYLNWCFFTLLFIKQCGNCGSSNIHITFSGGMKCDDCQNFRKDVGVKFVVATIILPFSLLGIFGLLGSILAGIPLNSNLVIWGVILSVFMALFTSTSIVLLKLFSGIVRKHEKLGVILVIITLLTLSILIVWIGGMFMDFLSKLLGFG